MGEVGWPNTFRGQCDAYNKRGMHEGPEELSDRWGTEPRLGGWGDFPWPHCLFELACRNMHIWYTGGRGVLVEDL